MADPLYPARWLPCERGAIPPALRLVPALLFRCRFQADSIAGTERLLLEKWIYRDIRVNRQVVAGKPEACRYYDQSGYVLPVGHLLRSGWNVIEGVYAPELYERDTRGAVYHYSKLQPTLDAFLLGPFAVRGNRLIRPSARLDRRPWEQQGYPYYSGTGIYTLTLPASPATPSWLEVGVHGGVAELRIRGRTVGTRLAEPYLFDTTRFLAGGKPVRAEIRVTHTLGSLFACQIKATVGSRIHPCHESGLAFARLVRFASGV
jgi:hypothetical protein